MKKKLIKFFTEDELCKIRTMLSIYHQGLSTGMIRVSYESDRKEYQDLIIKISDYLKETK